MVASGGMSADKITVKFVVSLCRITEIPIFRNVLSTGKTFIETWGQHNQVDCMTTAYNDL